MKINDIDIKDRVNKERCHAYTEALLLHVHISLYVMLNKIVS